MHGRTLIAAAAATAAAALALAAPAAAKQVTVTAADSGSRVELRPGDRVRVALSANPTTGYSWKFVARPARSIAELIRSTYREPDQSMPGAGGKQVYVFRARGNGTTGLETVYRQVGSNDVGRRFRLTIHVHG